MRQQKEIQSFEDLKVWKCARKLQSKISKLVKTFPKVEEYRLTNQIVRSSRSVARNIAEGYGRYHYQENIQFCRQARGSLCELLNDIITACEAKYIDKSRFDTLKKDVDRCHRLLNGYIAYLKKAKKKSQVKEDETIYDLVPDNH
ncbi:four helix bundle protein [Fodinibius sp.]|uniref:four helix bundle protein n=1 Tax=Fodinibius sp. TaxID=1872440 RepID=UPI003561F2F7